MKKVLNHTIYLVFILITLNVFSQNEKIKGYRIEGEDVIFSFNRNDYKKVTPDNFGEKQKFENLDINNVVVSGQFNNWSKYSWKMTKINDNTYELRKKLVDFTDEISWEFKFVINNTYWAEPSRRDYNITRATKYGSRLNAYNLKMYTSGYPDDNGNICFKLNGYTNSKKVILSGTFNRWNEDIYTMIKTEDGWELTLQLKPDEYQYKFIVDEKWIEDPNNLSKKRNEFDGYNSVINIKVPVLFLLNDYLDAKKVVLSGVFNDWSEEEYLMTKTKKGWTYTTNLSGGKHHYKFIIDGLWILDPKNSVMEYDHKGNINSVCMVK